MKPLLPKQIPDETSSSTTHEYARSGMSGNPPMYQPNQFSNIPATEYPTTSRGVMQSTPPSNLEFNIPQPLQNANIIGIKLIYKENGNETEKGQYFDLSHHCMVIPNGFMPIVQISFKPLAGEQFENITPGPVTIEPEPAPGTSRVLFHYDYAAINDFLTKFREMYIIDPVTIPMPRPVPFDPIPRLEFTRGHAEMIQRYRDGCFNFRPLVFEAPIYTLPAPVQEHMQPVSCPLLPPVIPPFVPTEDSEQLQSSIKRKASSEDSDVIYIGPTQESLPVPLQVYEQGTDMITENPEPVAVSPGVATNPFGHSTSYQTNTQSSSSLPQNSGGEHPADVVKNFYEYCASKRKKL